VEEDDSGLSEGEGNMSKTYEMFSRLMLLRLRKSREARQANTGAMNGD
tara:strand:+ start:1095 stop:1238 length:144 start_codon:yes stop_codon:yes gene_type:complete